MTPLEQIAAQTGLSLARVREINAQVASKTASRVSRILKNKTSNE